MDEGWLEVSVSSLSCLSSSILAALTDRQAPKQNSLQAGVIHIPYLHGPRQHRQKQAGAGGGQIGGGVRKKPAGESKYFEYGHKLTI